MLLARSIITSRLIDFDPRQADADDDMPDDHFFEEGRFCATTPPHESRYSECDANNRPTGYPFLPTGGQYQTLFDEEMTGSAASTPVPSAREVMSQLTLLLAWRVDLSRLYTKRIRGLIGVQNITHTYRVPSFVIGVFWELLSP